MLPGSFRVLLFTMTQGWRMAKLHRVSWLRACSEDGQVRWVTLFAGPTFTKHLNERSCSSWLSQDCHYHYHLNKQKFPDISPTTDQFSLVRSKTKSFGYKAGDEATEINSFILNTSWNDITFTNKETLSQTL